VGYDYRNHLDTTSVGRWRRPADTTIRYEQLSPKLGASWEIRPELAAIASYRESFRAPSESQIFLQGSSLNTTQLKPIVVPPKTLVGKWRGTSESVLRQNGRAQKRSTSVQFAVEAGPGDTVFVILEPTDPQACRLQARVDGLRAELVGGQTCVHDSGRGSVKMVVREGSALELRGEELQIALEVDLVVRDRRRQERMSSSMSATATRM
jgi:hypothetical protein